MSQPLFRSLPHPGDPDRFSVVLGDVEVGRFALRGLHDHSAGRALAAAIGGPRQARFPGPHGIALDVVIACEAHADAVFAAIAHRALARLYGAVFFCGGDPLRSLGVERPVDLDGLALGVFEPARIDNLARLRAAELGRSELRAA
jgi:hypothetical protein